MSTVISYTPSGVPFIADDLELRSYPAYTRAIAEKIEEVGSPTAAVLALLADAEAARDAAIAARDAALATVVPAARAKGYLAASHDLANNYTRITGYAKRYDVNAAAPATPILDSATGFITIPADGLYTLTAALLFATNSTGRRFLQIEKGTATPGTTNTVLIRQEMANQTAIYPGPSITLEDTFTAGDKVALVAYQTSGGVLAARGDFSPTSFTCRRVA